MNKNKAKGTAAETAVVRFLQSIGFTTAERRSLSGSSDRGDIAGLQDVCIEVKAHGRLAIPQWLRELDAEMVNSKASIGYLIVKPKGKGKVEEWWVIQRVKQWGDGMVSSHVVQYVVCGCGSQKGVSDA